MPSVLEVLNEPWAISASKKQEIDALYLEHRSRPKIDLDAFAAIANTQTSKNRAYQVVNGDAQIPIEGVISKKPSIFQAICGGTSTESVAAMFAQAMGDPEVDRVVLMVDSPGGTVDGVQSLANAIFQARGQKPIVSYVDGLAASAGYWIAAAADEVYLKDNTSFAGSIGIIATHVDVSGQEAKAGIKTTEITAGKYKRPDSSYAPLSEVGREVMQNRVDALYGQFLGDVAKFRGVDPEAAHEKMADGRVFMGQDAVQAGLADGVSTMDQLVAKKKSKDDFPPPFRKGHTMTAIFTQEQMDAAIAQAKQDAAKQASAPSTAQLQAEAVAAERSRVSGILALAPEGTKYAQLARELSADASMTVEGAKTRLNAQENADLKAELTAMQANAPKPHGQSGSDTPPATTTNSGVDEAALRTHWNAMSTASQKLFGGDFAKFAKSRADVAKQETEGTVKVFSRR